MVCVVWWCFRGGGRKEYCFWWVMLTFDREAEIAALAACYGVPERIVVGLDGVSFRPMTARDRVGEVCMVVRRPNGCLLTAMKVFYPAGAFRLLTGGIAHGEGIEAALLRETAEETSLTVVVRRFLAVIEYYEGAVFAPDSAPLFATLAFLLDEVGGTLATQDVDEQIGAFREVAPVELLGLAEVLEGVPAVFHPEIDGSWQDWGRFRAVVHRVVYDSLCGGGC